MPDKHAFLSASSSHRWINCPPSAALCAKKPNNSSPYAQQGTDVHSLCEHKVLTALGQASRDPTESLIWFDEEMEDCTDQYCTYVMEQLQETKKTLSGSAGSCGTAPGLFQMGSGCFRHRRLPDRCRPGSAHH